MRVVAGFLTLLFASSAFGAPALFPKPLHLVRRIDDRATKRAVSVDEYCAGNRIVTMRGARVTIADYGEQQLTEIDHEGGTYSVTRFEEIARAAADLRPSGHSGPSATSREAEPLTVTPAGVKSSAIGRSVDAYEIGSESVKIEIGIDRSIALSHAAVEALLGGAYPNVRRPEHDAMLRAASGVAGGRVSAQSTAGADDAYGLPVEQTVTRSMDGTSRTFHS